jgi:hypothetical protein
VGAGARRLNPLALLWLSVAPVEDDNGRLISEVASARTRIIGPIQELKKAGHRSRIVNPAHSLQRATKLIEEVDVVVFAKPFAASETRDFSVVLNAYRELLGRVPAHGPRVVLDVGEALFDAPGFTELYHALASRAAFVAPSRAMADQLAARLGITARVIADCFEGPANEPAAPLPTRFPRLFRLLDRLVSSGAERWRASLLWTGSRSDVGALFASLPELAEVSRWFPLHLLCLGWEDAGLEGIPGECARLGGDLTVSLAPAGPESLWRSLRACDVVWLAHDAATERARARGAGPLVETLRAGKFAVAPSLPAYRELAPYAGVGEPLGQALLWALRHPVEAARRVELGQQHVQAHFSAAAVARDWLEVLDPGRQDAAQ